MEIFRGFTARGKREAGAERPETERDSDDDDDDDDGMGVDLDQVEKEVLDAQAVADDQGNNVRALKAAVKAGEATKDQLNEAIALLKKLKADLDVKRKAFDEAVGGGSKASSVNKEAFRQALQNVLLSRCFLINSFAIYGGVAGLFDYGPPGCAIKANIQSYWKRHFVLEENMLEVRRATDHPHNNQKKKNSY